MCSETHRTPASGIEIRCTRRIELGQAQEWKHERGESMYRSDGHQAGADQVDREREVAGASDRRGSFVPGPRRELLRPGLSPRRCSLLVLLRRRRLGRPRHLLRLRLRSPVAAREASRDRPRHNERAGEGGAASAREQRRRGNEVGARETRHGRGHGGVEGFMGGELDETIQLSRWEWECESVSIRRIGMPGSGRLQPRKFIRRVARAQIRCAHRTIACQISGLPGSGLRIVSSSPSTASHTI